MSPVVGMTLVLAGLLTSHVRAATPGSKTSPTVTTTPTPTKTNCDLYFTTSISPSPRDYVCSRSGVLAQPTELARLCYDYNAPTYDAEKNCYRSCINNAKCVSYSWDRYTDICRLYGKPLVDMGFNGTAESSNLFWNLRGCFVCDTAPVPKKSICRTTPVLKPEKERKNATCDLIGQEPNMARQASYFTLGIYPDDCYNICIEFSKLGACESYQYDGTSSIGLDGCLMYQHSLRDEGFVADNVSYPGFGEWESWDLRGCFECDLKTEPSPTSTPCVPKEPVVAPTLVNGNFSRTIRNATSNLVLPANWTVYGTINTTKASNGNVYVGFYGGYNTAIQGNLINFNQNRYVSGRLYNLTFDLFVGPEFYSNRSGLQSCNFYYDISGAKYLSLSSLAGKTYSSAFVRRGPYGIDMSESYRGMNFGLTCSSSRYDSPGNVTVYLDNVSFTQNGKIVAGAGSGG